MKKNIFKNGDANNNPLLILVLAIVFIAASIAMIYLKLYEQNKILLLILILFGIVGIYLLIFGIYRAIIISQIKKLEKDPTATITTAKFISAKMSGFTESDKGFGVGNFNVMTDFSASVYKKIIYKYKDENGVEHQAKSQLSYTPNQIKYIQSLDEIKIKCKGKLSLIIEEIPDEKALVDFHLFKK